MKLDAATVLAIVSTIYYKAAWVDKFYSKFNTQETFHGKDGDTTVEMMHTSDFTDVYQTDAFTAVGLNLSDSGTMYFYLPQDGVDVNALAGNPDILKATVYGEDDEKRFNAQVNFSVPKFKISGKTDLIGIIRELGITDALDPSLSDFTPLTEDVDELNLSAANHAAMVEVDENGVTGAAYTELMVTEGAALPDKEIDFVLDRPFMFVVTGADGAVLFSGIVKNIK
jgi:serine protease inhibitor